MPADALTVLQSMSETQLTRQAIIPLLRAVYPKGKIEETHGVTEGGRDVICTDRHPVLNRMHTLCVQAKNHKVSFGATAGPYSIVTLRNQVQQARRTGIVKADGDTVTPDEVWVISTYSFPAGHRKLAQEFLADIHRESGRFIDGPEFVELLRARCHALVRDLESISDSRMAKTIAWLSQHHESKAFGLRLDRTVEEFHVKTRVFPSGGFSTALISGALTLRDWSGTVVSEIPQDDLAEFTAEGNGIVQTDLPLRSELQDLQPVVTKHSIPVTWTAYITDELMQRAWEKRDSTLSEEVSHATKGLPVPIERTYHVALRKWADRQRKDLKTALRRLPRSLTAHNGAAVRNVVTAAQSVESGLARLNRVCGESGSLVRTELEASETPSLQVPTERMLLDVAPRVVVQGAPGAGKTTFARRLAISLLRNSQRVLFVPCSAVTPNLKNATLSDIAVKCSAPGTPTAWTLRNSVVIVDGLDEAPFDLSSAILADSKKCKHGIVATARAAFPTQLREDFATLEISGFTASDRNSFFQKWFKDDVGRRAAAERLVASYDDIDQHTRLPLIATLVAALVENDYAPTTRAEIYAQRLDLLLERWESVKGLRRLTVPKKSQLRFLKHLAFIVHRRAAGRASRFGWDEIRDAFSTGLGRLGDQLDPEDLVNKLVVVSGVLQSDGKNFTFGHLSFQEHLTGWYLVDYAKVDLVESLLGKQWWAEALNFYAGIGQDITELIERCEVRGSTPVHAAQLRTMLQHAPHTGSVAAEVLESTRQERS
jgi:hypothetical protein